MRKSVQLWRKRRPKVTDIFGLYWSFARERQAIYLRRLMGFSPPFTSDPILSTYKFTNAYRAADRTSQYLIREVIYGNCAALRAEDIVLRILLFKIFNRIETWQHISGRCELTVAGFDASEVAQVLEERAETRKPLYSAAYIMPPPRGELNAAKHVRHVQLLSDAIRNGLVDLLCSATSLRTLYKHLMNVPSFGPFLAFQYAVDVAYSEVGEADESEFVVAGPGAKRGIDKCFVDRDGMSYEDIIMWVTDDQEQHLASYGLDFTWLGDRRLQPVDCQNIFCEIDKYTRASHPALTAVGHRSRIKQRFTANSRAVSAWFPPKWGINGIMNIDQPVAPAPPLGLHR